MTSRKIRNGVGVRDAHTVVLAISDDPVTFWEFARLFREGLGTPDALFLDGSIPSLYVPALHRHDASASQARWPRGRHMLDVLAKYPKADEPTLVNWVRRWTGHWEYLKRIAHGCNPARP